MPSSTPARARTRDIRKAEHKARADWQAANPHLIAPNQPQRVIAFAGDWHGSTAWANARLQGLGEEGIKVVCHAGDFGLWPGPSGKRYLDVVEKVCDRYAITMLVTPGNHEDWDRLVGPAAKQPHDRGDGWGAVQWMRPHVAFLPRGHRWTIEVSDDDGRGTGVRRTFVSLGGAPSVDYEHRTVGKSWWPSEQITVEDVARVAAGGHAEIMIAHDSPDRPYCVPLVDHIVHSPTSMWSAMALDYARAGRERIHDAYLAVEPKVFVHGHYHVSGMNLVEHRGLTMNDEGGNKTGRGIVVSLDADGTAHNIIRFDLASMEFLSERAR